jgi:hypothetical protein
VTPEPTSESTAEATESSEAATEEPPEAVRFAAPAPVISAESGDVAAPIDPANASASVCVVLFEDVNANRLQDGGESTLADGNILLTTDGTPAGQHATDDSTEPFCFDGLASGNYTVEAAPPGGYGLTTPSLLRMQVAAGAQVSVAFGAAEGVEAVALPTPDGSEIVNTATAEDGENRTASNNGLPDNIGLLVFGAAGVVLVVGMGITMLMVRRR